jgi:hypothetical protein
MAMPHHDSLYTAAGSIVVSAHVHTEAGDIVALTAYQGVSTATINLGVEHARWVRDQLTQAIDALEPTAGGGDA